MMKTQFLILYVILILTGGYQVAGQKQTNPTDYLKAVAFFNLKNYPRSLELTESLIQENTDEVHFILLKGKALYESGHYNEARQTFLEANNLQNNIASLELAKTYARLGDEGNMYHHLEEHLSSRYKKPETRVKLDSAFLPYENSGDWKTFWSKEWDSSKEKALQETAYYIKYENYNQAIKLADEAIEKSNRDHAMYAKRGLAYANLKDHNQAIRDYSRAIKQYRRNAEYYVLRAKSLEAVSKFGKAIEDVREAMELEPENLELIKYKSVLHTKNEDYEPAEANMLLYLELFPDNENNWFQCANMYMLFEKPIKALPYINKCLEKNQSKPEYFKTRGDAYLQTKMYKYAIKDYSMALDLEPDNAETYLNKGLARKRSGDDSGACADWDKARRLGSREAMKFMLEADCEIR